MARPPVAADQPVMEMLEPRLLLNADVVGVEPVLLPEASSSEPAIIVASNQEEAALPEEQTQPCPIDLALFCLAAQPVEVGGLVEADVGTTGTRGESPQRELEIGAQMQPAWDRPGASLDNQCMNLVPDDQQDNTSTSNASLIEIRGPPVNEAGDTYTATEVGSGELVHSSSAQGEQTLLQQGYVVSLVPGREADCVESASMKGQEVRPDPDVGGQITCSGLAVASPGDEGAGVTRLPFVYRLALGGNDVTLHRNSDRGAETVQIVGESGVVLAERLLETTMEIIVEGVPHVDDTLTIDFSGGSLALPITFHGGDGGFDSMVIRGGSFSAARYDAGGPDSGTIVLDGTTIRYTGLEPITDDSVVAERVFAIETTGIDQQIRIGDDGNPDNGYSTIDSNGTGGSRVSRFSTRPRH